MSTTQELPKDNADAVKYEINHLLDKRRISLNFPGQDSFIDQKLENLIREQIDSLFKTEMEKLSKKSGYQKALLDIIKETTNPEDRKLLLDCNKKAIFEILNDDKRYKKKA